MFARIFVILVVSFGLIFSASYAQMTFTVQLSPLKQISKGIMPEDVVCNQGLVLVLKESGNSPACVKTSTAKVLIERSWAKDIPIEESSAEDTKSLVLDIAENFIVSSPTFAFDGMKETLQVELTAIRESFPEQYVIQAEFSSSQAGYGDRTGLMLAQVITPHTMELVVVSGEVISAKMDKTWDELNQKMLQSSTKDPSETVSSNFFLVYNKEGGIAGISESVTIESSTKEMIIQRAGEKKSILVEDDTLNVLYESIEGLIAMVETEKHYPPVMGSADFFTHTLQVSLGEKEYRVSWTDTSETIPKDAQKIVQKLDEIILGS